MCTRCPAGKADTDSDPSTPCVECAAGTYAPAGTMACTLCVSGMYDHDGTVKDRAAITGEGMTSSDKMKYYSDVRSSSTPCVACGAGNSSSEMSSVIAAPRALWIMTAIPSPIANAVWIVKTSRTRPGSWRARRAEHATPGGGKSGRHSAPCRSLGSVWCAPRLAETSTTTTTQT